MPEDDATLAHAGPPKSALAIPGYRIERALGEGGMGAVYLAQDEVLHRRVAIKVISRGFASDPAIRERFLREARMLATVEHPDVVRVYSFGASEERAYLVLEYVEGETLADRIARGPIPVAEARDITKKVIGALAAAWEKRIVHRDVKPSNILFNARGDLKVADFGLAKGAEKEKAESSLTQTGYILGSPHYVAPEQAHGREVDFRADIYSLGVTLFEMLTGRRPFEGPSALAVIAQHLNQELPVDEVRTVAGKQMADLIAWMTAKNQDDRPSSYAKLLNAMNGALPSPAAPDVTRRAGAPLRVVSIVCFALTLVMFVVFHFRSVRLITAEAGDDRLVVAVTPFWGPNPESASEGRSMAALVQQQIVTRLGSAAKVIGIDETKVPVRDADSARALGERLNATAVIWGQAFALSNEREIQPSLTVVPRKHSGLSNVAAVSLSQQRGLGGDLPAAPDALRVQAQSANQIDLRKTSAEGIGDLVTFVAATHALSQNNPQRALELLSQARQTADALYQKARCLLWMQRDADAVRELEKAMKLEPAHAQSLAMLSDIDVRASRFAAAAAKLRAAAATGHRFTTSEAALYNNVLYVREHYRAGENEIRDAPTLLAIDPIAERVVQRWELPGLARLFSVDETGMTIKCDIGPPREGELMTLHFVNDHFQGEPLPHTMPLVARLRLMRPAWYLAQNFGRDLATPGIKLRVAHLRYSPIDAEASAPKTLPELKAALEKEIARDPTQPWHRMSLAFTLWELGDRPGANRVIEEMFAQPNSGTPYYVWSWMIRQFEPLGHFDWADRAYAEALKRRKAEHQPIAMTATVERMVDSPFIRRTANVAAVSPEPKRDHLWLLRTRELTGISWGGDELTAAAWARYLRAHGDAAGAAEEEKVRDRAHAMFGGARMALTTIDMMRAAQIAIVVAIVVVLAVARRRNALALLAILLVFAGTARFIAASRVRLIESIPVPLADDPGHPIVAATLDELLATRDSDDLRFIAAVSHQMAGDVRRAAELYRTLDGSDAAENLRNIESRSPDHMPDADMLTRAFFRLCPYALWETLKSPWGPHPAAGNMYSVAYESAQAFYLSLLLAVALTFLALSAEDTPRAFAIALFVFATVFVGVAYLGYRSESSRAKLPVSGKHFAMMLEPRPAYPFPPDPTFDESMRRALANSEAMRLFWIVIGLSGLTAIVSGAVLLRSITRVPMEKRELATSNR